MAEWLGAWREHIKPERADETKWAAHINQWIGRFGYLERPVEQEAVNHGHRTRDPFKGHGSTSQLGTETRADKVRAGRTAEYTLKEFWAEACADIEGKVIACHVDGGSCRPKGH